MIARASLVLLLSPLAISQRFTTSTVALPGLGEHGALGVPCPVDLDADGLTDLVTFAEPSGDSDLGYRLLFFRRLPATSGQVRFADPVEMRVNGQPIKAKGRCNCRPTPQLADLDGDGRLDLVILSDIDKMEALRGLTATTYGDPIPLLHVDGRQLKLPRQIGSFALTDWNEDGRADLMLGTDRGVLLLAGEERGFADAVPLQAGPRPIVEFSPETDKGIDCTTSCTSMPVIPTAVDWDGDGDRDLLVTDGTDTVHCFTNVGSRRQPQLAASRRVDLGGEARKRLGPCAADWNGDGYMDLLVVGYQLMQAERMPGRALGDPERLELDGSKARLTALEGQLHALNRQRPVLTPEALAKRRAEHQRLCSAIGEIKARIDVLTRIEKGDPPLQSARWEIRLHQRS